MQTVSTNWASAGVPNMTMRTVTNFQPANFVLGFGEIGGRRVIVGGEDFTKARNPAGLRKSVYAEQLALQFKVPLIRLHEGGGGSVGAPDRKKSAALGEPVFSTSRFVPLAETLGHVPVATAALNPVPDYQPRASLPRIFRYDRKCRRFDSWPKVVKRALGTI